jgi:hypothetical protein
MMEKAPDESEKPTISRKRKIIVLIFVIGFWIFFYWYKSYQPPPPIKTSPEIKEEKRLANP